MHHPSNKLYSFLGFFIRGIYLDHHHVLDLIKVTILISVYKLTHFLFV